jgi:Uma2 family endonuclease
MSIAAADVAPQVLTWEEYLAEEAINQRYDILDGVRVIMGSPELDHQEITLNIAELLRAYQRRTRRGRTVVAPYDVLISRRPLRTRQPDVLFISHAQLVPVGGARAKAPLEVAAELVVEVLSPSETLRAREEKIEDYRRIGVRECWVVSLAAQTVEVLRLSADGVETIAVYGSNGTARSAVFEDLAVPVAAIFTIEP